MADIKLTKNELRAQQDKLSQLQKYLPTLQLKKAMLQAEVNEARIEIVQLEEAYRAARADAEQWVSLLSQRVAVDPRDATKIVTVRKRYENIAGIDVPYLEGIDFEPMDYSLFETPPWVDGVVVDPAPHVTASWWIETLEGGHVVTPGDFIITGVKGERYPCKPDIFAATYDEVSR